ncbi:MAG TPA: MobF family relaxase, partial [Chthoniobacterales bacterium]
MLTKAEIKSAQGCERYFDRHLTTEEYYGKTVGIWQGGLVEKLGLDRDVTKEAFKAVLHNVHPVTGERLTARTNGTRIEHGWELQSESRKWEWKAKEVDNRDIGWDFTYSMPKSASVYYEVTKDREVMQAFLETNAALVGWIQDDLQVRVRVNGASHDRDAQGGLCATFLHETARPVSGATDPHVHCHNTFLNVAFDPEEQRLKAAKFRKVIENEWRYKAKAHALFAEKLVELGHGLRKTANGIEMQVITPDEVQAFSKRSQQIQELERTLRPELERRADAAVHAAAARGEVLSPDDAYAGEKAKLAREHRQGKGQATLEGKALEDNWRDQLAPGRLEQITKDVSLSLESVGLMEPEAAKRHTIKHCFERQSVAKESELLIELLKVGIGRVSGAEAERFVQSDPRLAHSLAQPG